MVVPDAREAEITLKAAMRRIVQMNDDQPYALDRDGLVKLLVSPADRTLLGVHAFGAGATEVVHIGQAVMGLGGTIDYLVESVFNYPTFAEAYKVAALDALNKLRAVTLV